MNCESLGNLGEMHYLGYGFTPVEAAGAVHGGLAQVLFTAFPPCRCSAGREEAVENDHKSEDTLFITPPVDESSTRVVPYKTPLFFQLLLA